MKKYILLFILCFGILSFSFGQNDNFFLIGDINYGLENEGDSFNDGSVSDDADLFDDTDLFDEPKGPFRMKNRMIELGFANASLGFSNDFLTAKGIFQKTFVLDLDELKDGFRMNLNMAVSPFYFSFNRNDNWGFGLGTNVQATGLVGLSGDMLTFKNAKDAKSEIGGAAFVDIGAPFFFHYKNFKIKIKPSFFYPIMYVDSKESDISYTFKPGVEDTEVKTELKLGYKMRIYTAFPLEGDSFNLTTTVGLDFHLGTEYPLAKVLGITDKFGFLDFDVGLDMINFPMIPAVMKDYMEIYGKIGSDEAINFFGDDFDFDNFVDMGDPVYGTAKKRVLRPFKLLTWAGWRPFNGSELFTVIPTLGFAINPLYLEPFSMEGGIKTRLDLANIFILTLGVGYEDRHWKNSAAMALNLRAFELDLGIDMRSENFAKSWQGAGVGVAVGLKFGW